MKFWQLKMTMTSILQALAYEACDRMRIPLNTPEILEMC